jgi:prophage regulatory protein
MSNNEIQFLTLSDVCEMSGVNRITMWRWVREGKFPQPVRLSVRRIFWLRPVVEAFLQSDNDEIQFNADLLARNVESEFE